MAIIRIVRHDNKIELHQDSGGVRTLSAALLRSSCPCALCLEARGEGQHDKPLLPQKKSMLRVVDSVMAVDPKVIEILPVGKYGISISWSDGHNSGIYSFELLARLE